MQQKALHRFVRAIESFRQLNRDLLANEMLAFLIVATRDEGQGVPFSEVAESLGVSMASASRNVNFLSQHGANGREGAKLVMLTENPENRRQRIVHLTPKGKAFKRQLEVLLDGAA